MHKNDDAVVRTTVVKQSINQTDSNELLITSIWYLLTLVTVLEYELICFCSVGRFVLVTVYQPSRNVENFLYDHNSMGINYWGRRGGRVPTEFGVGKR